MKTINSKNNTKIFTDPETGKYAGFAGTVELYSSSVYVDTRTGKGYDAVMKGLDRLISYLASKYRFDGFTFEDNRQHIAVHILECLPKYDPRHNVKLSSFVQTCVNNRLINEIRKQGRLTRNSTTLRICSYSVECAECKSNFDITVSFDDDIKNHTCNVCGYTIDETNIVRINKPELSLGMVFAQRSKIDRSNGGIDDQSNCDSSDKSLPVLSNVPRALDDEIIDKCDIEALIEELENDDPVIAKFVKLYCCEDYSIYAAAKAVGLSGTGATLKLKSLQQRRKKIRKK